MRGLIPIVVIGVAVAELIPLSIFLAGSLSADPLGNRIARGVLAPLGVPFLLFTAPAVAMALAGRSPTGALALAAAGAAAMWVLWRMARMRTAQATITLPVGTRSGTRHAC